MTDSLRDMYRFHHKKERPDDFSVMEKERSEILKKEIGQGKNILDIGCRDGVLTKHFVNGNKVLGVDIDDESLAKAKSKLGIETMFMDLNGDWNELSGRKFDVVVAGEVLEHLFYPEKVLDKISRYLNPDGLFIGSIPNAFSLKHRLRYLKGSKKYTPLSDPTHINQFSYREIILMLRNYFREVEVIGLGKHKFLAKKFPSLFAFDLFFICRDPL